MYVDPSTTPLAKFYFFNQILEDSNIKIRDPLYVRINHDIRKKLINPKSNLSQIIIYIYIYYINI